MTAASAARFYLPSACFPERSPPSCGGDPLQRRKAPNVVGQILQANFGARSHDANCETSLGKGVVGCSQHRHEDMGKALRASRGVEHRHCVASEVDEQL